MTRARWEPEVPLGSVERILDERVVKRPEDQRPAEHRSSLGFHLERVPKAGSACRERFRIEVVRTVEAAGSRESEPNTSPRRVLLDEIANRRVATACAGSERPVELHRGPPILRPEPVVIGCETVDQCTYGGGRRVENTLVDIEDSHLTDHDEGRNAPVQAQFRYDARVDSANGDSAEPARSSVRERLGLILGPAGFLLMLAIPAPEGMSIAAWRTAALALLMAILWITEAVPISVTALLPIVLLPLMRVQEVTAATAPYANPVIFLFMGGFMIALALERCGLHRRLALNIVARSGTGSARLIGGFMIATAFLSMWISNTAAVLMMLPMATSIIQLCVDEGGDPEEERNFSVALLLGLAYAASIGGLGTLIGTPPNALLAGFMNETYGVEIGFGQWMLLGVPLVMISLPLTWLLLTRVLHPLKGNAFASGSEAIGRELELLGKRRRDETIVAAITAITALLWVIRPLLDPYIPGLNDTTIAMAGAFAMFVVPMDASWTRFGLEWKDIERLPWSVLLLFGGGLALADAIQKTGLAGWLGTRLGALENWPVLLVAFALTVVVIFMTELTSNTATAATFLPVIAAIATGMSIDPMLLAVPAVLAASCAFMMPVATPPNAIVYGSGRLTVPEMARAGLGLNVMFSFLILALMFTIGRIVFGV